MKALGSSPYTVDAYAKQKGVEYDEKQKLLRLTFPNVDAALHCVAENRDFRILRNQPQITFYEFVASKTPVRGKDLLGLSDYIIPAYTGGEAIAFIQQQADSVTPVKIVKPGEIKGKNQISVAEGGLCASSPNLEGKTITIRSLPIIYPEVISELHSELPEAQIYMVVTDDKGRFQLFTIHEPEIIPAQQYNTAETIIQAKVDPKKVECRAFS